MLIKTLVSWGGHDFNLVPGDTIEVAEEIGLERIGAGLAEEADPPPPPKKGR